MFSANENLMLRQHKRRIVDRIEQTMPEEALDFGTTVMVMQVSCKAPGCVPLETAIIIVFPNSPTELVPGLPESQNGGSYKTKILKPMAEVKEEDILEALPPAFEGGQRTMEKLCIHARDVMLAQITQLFGEEEDTLEDRRAMAEYLQTCLKTYVANGCEPPELGESFPTLELTNPEEDEKKDGDSTAPTAELATASISETESSTATTSSPGKALDIAPQGSGLTAGGLLSGNAPPKHQRAIRNALNPSMSNKISKLFDREHAPGIRQPGCPCCDPENPSTLIDNLMML